MNYLLMTSKLIFRSSSSQVQLHRLPVAFIHSFIYLFISALCFKYLITMLLAFGTLMNIIRKNTAKIKHSIIGCMWFEPQTRLCTSEATLAEFPVRVQWGCSKNNKHLRLDCSSEVGVLSAVGPSALSRLALLWFMHSPVSLGPLNK